MKRLDLISSLCGLDVFFFVMAAGTIFITTRKLDAQNLFRAIVRSMKSYPEELSGG